MIRSSPRRSRLARVLPLLLGVALSLSALCFGLAALTSFPDPNLGLWIPALVTALVLGALAWAVFALHGRRRRRVEGRGLCGGLGGDGEGG